VWSNALYAAFGQHHDRAVHTKGTILEGTFTPAPEARTIVRTPVFAGGPRPVVARFSLFAGVPTLPDNDDSAAPCGFAVKIKALDGDDFDIETNQHRNFIVATFDEFAVFMRALGATKPDSPHPNPVEQFLSTHPTAKEFLGSRTYRAVSEQLLGHVRVRRGIESSRGERDVSRRRRHWTASMTRRPIPTQRRCLNNTRNGVHSSTEYRSDRHHNSRSTEQRSHHSSPGDKHVGTPGG
jgi:hypothetical protein